MTRIQHGAAELGTGETDLDEFRYHLESCRCGDAFPGSQWLLHCPRCGRSDVTGQRRLYP